MGKSLVAKGRFKKNNFDIYRDITNSPVGKGSNRAPPPTFRWDPYRLVVYVIIWQNIVVGKKNTGTLTPKTGSKLG